MDERDQTIARMHAAGEKHYTIGLAVGLTPQGVSYRVKKLGLTRVKQRSLEDIGPDRVRRLYQSGMRVVDICKKLGIPSGTLSGFVERLGLKRRRRRGKAPVWPDDAKFRQMWTDGVICREIAKEFNTTKQHVCRHAQELGLPGRIKGIGTVNGRYAQELYESGWSLTDVARHLKFPRSSLRRLLQMRGVVMRDKCFRLESDPTTAKAVRLRRQGLPYARIGELLGLNANQVGERVRRVLGKGTRAC